MKRHLPGIVGFLGPDAGLGVGHLSSEKISRWIAGERSPMADLHVRDCPHCRAEIERFESAVSVFREWYSAAPDHPAAPLRRSRRPIVALIAALASLAAGIILIRGPAPPPRPFVAIPYAAPLAPYERASIVRMELPVSALIAAGFEVRVPDATLSLEADVLVGQDGRPYAIRPVISSRKKRRTEQ